MKIQKKPPIVVERWQTNLNEEDFDETIFEPIDILSTFDNSLRSWVLPRLYNTRNDQPVTWRIGWSDETSEIVTIFGGVNKQTHRRPMTSTQTKTNRERAFKKSVTSFKNTIESLLYYRKNEGVPTGRLVMRGKDKEIDQIKSFPVVCQPKLDGVRCVASLSNGQVVLRSKTNKLWQNKTSIRTNIEKMLKFLPSGTEIDGELYIHGRFHESIISISTTTKTIHKDEELLEYHIFDLMIPNMPFEKRHKLLEKGYNINIEDKQFTSKIKKVRTYRADSKKELTKYYKRELLRLYEGIIVRYCCSREDIDNANSQYKLTLYVNKQTSNIVKLKEVRDEEGKILGVIENKDTGQKCFQCQDPRGNVFKLVMIGTRKQREEMLVEANIGKIVTYQYRMLSSDKKIPKHAYGVRIRAVD